MMSQKTLVGIILGLMGAATSTAQQITPATSSVARASEAAPVVISRARQYELTSRINGQTYRIMVSLPFMFDPAAAYPVVYVLDANSRPCLSSGGKVQTRHHPA
jgi:hypothetical protein